MTLKWIYPPARRALGFKNPAPSPKGFEMTERIASHATDALLTTPLAVSGGKGLLAAARWPVSLAAARSLTQLASETQVDGCAAALTQLRHYHQRYKVCQEHLKVPHVIHEGIVQRFCQQCSRFHAITEFEGDKRSCRAQLQRHNARRRRKAAERSKARASAPGGASPGGASPGDPSEYRRRSTGENRASDAIGVGDSQRPIRSQRLAARAAARSFARATGEASPDDSDGDVEESVSATSAPSNLGGTRSVPEPGAAARAAAPSPGPLLLEVRPHTTACDTLDLHTRRHLHTAPCLHTV